MMSDLLYRLRALFRRSSVERELDDELRFHFDRHVQKGIESGLTREDAARQANRIWWVRPGEGRMPRGAWRALDGDGASGRSLWIADAA